MDSKAPRSVVTSDFLTAGSVWVSRMLPPCTTSTRMEVGHAVSATSASSMVGRSPWLGRDWDPCW